jgi:energy-coupling factor transport system permease protein
VSRPSGWRPEPIDRAIEGGALALSADDAAFLARLAPATPSPYHRLNPLTKAIAATVESIGAFVIGGYLGPLAIIGLAILPAALAAGVAGRLVRISLLLTLPIAISVVLVSVFTRAGTHVLFSIGPFDATSEGVDFAGQTLVRLLAISTSIGLFGLTTEPRSFVLDLERRGLSPRFAFVALATLEAVPAMVERANVIASAQRARGLDTEGSVRARLRGLLPLVGPVILSSLTEVEERSLALEVRAFGKPGQRHLLWRIPDNRAQLVVRVVLLVALLGAIVARLIGQFPNLP